MMKYFELIDDVTVPDRWHLGEVILPDGTEPRLRAGIQYPSETHLTTSVIRRGRVLDFSLTSFAIPIANNLLAHAIKTAAGSDVQCIPVDIIGQPSMVVLNSVRVVPCLDERCSEFVKWTKNDHRPDLAGQYRQVTNLVLDLNKIPEEAGFFRVDGWLIALIVSETVQKAMVAVGCIGAKFIELQTNKLDFFPY